LGRGKGKSQANISGFSSERHWWLVIALILSCALHAQEAPSIAPDVRADAEWLANVSSRVVGSDGHDEIQGRLLEQIQTLPGVRVWTHRFPVVVAIVKQAHLTIAAGAMPGTHRIYPLWPAGARMNTTPQEGLDGQLIYIGQGRAWDIPPRSLRNQIAVMEISAGDRWQDAFSAGAKAIILLGTADETNVDSESHITDLPINVPRFYLPAGALADCLRTKLPIAPVAASLVCESAWESRDAINIYALVKPPQTGGQPALALCAPFDSMSFVPELSPGANVSVNCSLLLNALRRFSAQPPARPILFAFIDAYAIAQLGTRRMLHAIAVPADDPQMALYRSDEQKNIDRGVGLRRLAEEAGSLGVIHPGKFRTLHRFIKDEVAREVLDLDATLNRQRIEKISASAERKAELDRQIQALSTRKQARLGAQAEILNTPLENPSELARDIWHAARQRIDAQLREAQERQEYQSLCDSLRDDMNDALGLDKTSSVPICFMLGIDLSDAGICVGPQPHCGYAREGVWGHNAFFTWLRGVNDNERIWTEDERRALNMAPLQSHEFYMSHAVGEPSVATSPGEVFGVPNAGWTTLDAPRLRLDTPADRADRLDWGRLFPQIDATFAMIKRLAGKTDFASQTGRQSWVRVSGNIVDESPGEPVPRLPMPGFLATMLRGAGANGGLFRSLGNCKGVRRQEFTFTGSDGGFRFDAVLNGSWDHTSEFIQAYLVAPDGSIRRAVEQSGNGFAPSIVAKLNVRHTADLRAATFNCTQLTATRLFDPRYLMPLSGSLLDVARMNEPKRSNYFITFDGVMSAFIEDNAAWGLILRAGITRNAMLYLNVDDPSTASAPGKISARGLKAVEPMPMHPIHMSARDLYRIDDSRLADFRKAGIRSQAIEDLHAQTGKLLNQSEAALAADDGGAFMRAAGAALSHEIRAYQAIRDTANDVIRAAIVLLLVLVPFAFAFERLAFASPNIYRQLSMAGAVFAAMTAILWSFHPAFKLSGQPLLIIMAFAILCMSLVVIAMIHSKFFSSLDEWRSGRAESSAAKNSRWGIMAAAVRLGLANMRKRKVRTTLTGLTVALITFALLCFSSTSSYVGSRDFSLGARAPSDQKSDGVLIREASMRPLEPITWDRVDGIVGSDAVRAKQQWWVMPWQGSWRLHARNPSSGAQISLRAALGLDASESLFSRIDRVCPNWERFADGTGCYLAETSARELGVRAGDQVVIAGRSLELIGTYHPQELESTLRTLDGHSMLPADFSLMGLDLKNRMTWTTLSQLAGESESGSAMISSLSPDRLPGDSIAILPNDVLRGVGNVTLRNISIKSAPPEAVKTLAKDLAGRIAYPIYYSAPDGTHVLASTPLLPTAPKALLIPLLIGALIIFNTMLSSISERKREIRVYTSLGLAPMHIAVLFLAEAATYGLLGGIFGYIAGQGLATFLSTLGWMGNITLNYSGTQTILVMSAIMIVVLLSSLIPAYLAGKLAAPSNETSWKVPDAVGDVIQATLPFTVTGGTVNGMAKYLYDWFDAHREGAIGLFSTDDLKISSVQLPGLEAMDIEGVTWLSPFDLSVRQRFLIFFQSTADEDVYSVEIELTRISGQGDDWSGLNRFFLGALRKQLLGWRKITPAQMRQYIKDAKSIGRVPATAAAET
jgi:hypothetical protein